MFRTRAPLATSIATVLPLDLHVLGLPLAFILSQDQTLHSKEFLFDPIDSYACVLVLPSASGLWLLAAGYLLLAFGECYSHHAIPQQVRGRTCF